MLPYQQHVVDEAAKVASDLEKLDAFRTDHSFRDLDPDEQIRQHDQAHHMRALLQILRERIGAFNVAAGPVPPKFDGDFTVDLPAYRSHKTVWAAKIVAVDFVGGRLDLAPHGVVEISDAWMEKRVGNKRPTDGYFMLYPDGYTSWSPAEAFEGGYTRLPA